MATHDNHGRFLKSFKITVVCTLLILLSAGCHPKTHFVLLPDPDGKVGRIELSNPKGTQTLDQPWQSAEVVGLDKAPGKPSIMGEQKVRTMFREALEAQPKPAVIFLLYFKTDSHELTAQSLDMLPDILEAIKSRNSNDISIVGHTDSVGKADYNLNLSLKRARTVTDILISKGIDPGIIEIDYFGKEKPLVATPDGVEEPRNRRVEITIR